MKKNVGSLDKNIRLGAGIVIIILGLVFKSLWGILGLVLVGTALMGWCPPYELLGINTMKEGDVQGKEG